MMERNLLLSCTFPYQKHSPVPFQASGIFAKAKIHNTQLMMGVFNV